MFDVLGEGEEMSTEEQRAVTAYRERLAGELGTEGWSMYNKGDLAKDLTKELVEAEATFERMKRANELMREGHKPVWIVTFAANIIAVMSSAFGEDLGEVMRKACETYRAKKDVGTIDIDPEVKLAVVDPPAMTILYEKHVDKVHWENEFTRYENGKRAR